MTYRPPKTLAKFIAREDLYSDDHAPVAGLLAAAAKDPAKHPEIAQAWGKLAAHMYYSDVLIDALGATVPNAALRAAAAGIAEHTAEVRAQLLAAAIELGDAAGFRAVRSAMARLTAINFFGFKDFKHPQIRKLAGEQLFVDAAIRALRRLPLLPSDSISPPYDRRLLWGLVSLVALAGGEGAAEALENSLVAAGDDVELREQIIAPRLRAEKQRAHVAPALARLAGERDGKLAPLPFAAAAAPIATADAKPGKARSTSKRKPASIDANLHFALLQALADARRLKLPPTDDDAPERMNRKVRKELLATPIPATFAAKLVKLSWSAGEKVQFSLIPGWSGEDDVFHVTHLHHLGHLRALETLYVELAAPGLDLAPLAGLPKLRSLTLQTQVATLAPLLDLPALKEARLAYDDIDANRTVRAELERRGVKLHPPR